jgi:hypothetical protein
MKSVDMYLILSSFAFGVAVTNFVYLVLLK